MAIKFLIQHLIVGWGVSSEQPANSHDVTPLIATVQNDAQLNEYLSLSVLLKGCMQLC